jgi:RNA polymerase sigma-70 factor (ECF subfamily)
MQFSDIPLEELPGGEDGADGAMLRDLVQKGVRRLSPSHRAVITLCMFEGLSVKEAADALDSPEGTVKSRLHYAKNELAKFFDNCGVKI